MEITLGGGDLFFFLSTRNQLGAINAVSWSSGRVVVCGSGYGDSDAGTGGTLGKGRPGACLTESGT